MHRVFDRQFAVAKTLALAHVYYTLLQLDFAFITPLSLSSVSLASRATTLGVSAHPRRNLPATGGRANAKTQQEVIFISVISLLCSFFPLIG